jgi:hypothetical protein
MHPEFRIGLPARSGAFSRATRELLSIMLTNPP